ncbi:MAG: CHASE3 domain-containing protein [Pseudomonadales bacterium]|nr:CHASE3 domain-containing protein [Pseudomonadales bacterium]
MKLKTQLFLATGFTLLMLLSVGGVVYWSINQLLDDTKWVEHTYKVIGQANRLKSHMVDQQTGMRGHVVSGIDEFLEPYREGYVEFSSLIISMKETVSDNPPQVRRLEGVERLASQWRQNVAERYIRIRKNILQGEDLEREIAQVIDSGIGKQTMDALRAQVARSSLSEAEKDRVLLDMINMETGLRGFLLTEKAVYLEPYEAGVAVIGEHLKSVGASAELTQAVYAWIDNYAERLIQLAMQEAETADMDALYIEFEKKEGRQYMNKIRDELALFIQEEQRLLALRLERQEKTTFYAQTITEAGVFLAFVIGGLVMIAVSRNIIKNQTLRQQKLQSDTELKLLKAQVDSHFLFNTLNTIYYTANKDPNLSRQLVMDLSNLMRVNLKRQEELCSLQDELDHVNRYLRIEQVRFQDKLEVVQQVELDAEAIQLPMFSVQTLVENAIKHGISKSLSGGKVTIHCYQRGKAIHIDVADTANTFAANNAASAEQSQPASDSVKAHKKDKSLGLNLVRNRLNQYSHYQSELLLFTEDQQTIARIILK